jgi:RNA polymerase sigma-70 factor (ECF subfamily)
LSCHQLIPAAAHELIGAQEISSRMTPDGPSGGVETPDRRLLQAARDGDNDAYRRLVEPYRAALQAHCYRMLGSPQDAEDALQDTLLRSWRGLDRFEADKPLRPWLYRIATNASLDTIAKRPKRVLPLDQGPPSAPETGPGRPLAESIWIEPYPDELLDVEDGYAAPEARYEQRESVELAFIAALQHLPPRQRAVLILREVLGFSAREVAQSLQTTAASVNSALQRARQAVEERLPARSQQETLRSLGDERVRSTVESYVRAWESRDVDGMVSMLVEEATFAMPPHPRWFRGRDAVIAFISATGRPRLRHLLTRANGQPAIGWYLWDERQGLYTGVSLEVLTLEGGRVREIVAFAQPSLLSRFGLPETLAAER